MGHMLRCIIVLLIADSMVNFRVLARGMSKFAEYGLVPDIIPVAPTGILKVNYWSGVEVDQGKELTPTQVKDQPSLQWETEPHTFYTVVMTDPDAPSRKEPTYREWLHWLVGNVPECNVSGGDVLAAYVGAGPPPGTGKHRYALLVYKQPGKLNFDEMPLPNTTGEGRTNFAIAKFATKYKLGNPIAGDFFEAQYDDYVPLLYKQLGA